MASPDSREHLSSPLIFNPGTISKFRVPQGEPVDLSTFPTRWDELEGTSRPGRDLARADAEELLNEHRIELARVQELLWASDTHSLLLILQGMDTAGKDSTIKHVMSGMNPQGCDVSSFKAPSEEERDHDFLWRYVRKLPERGRIGVFNRSYYEEVVVVRVHPDLLEKERLPPEKRGDGLWKERYEDINALETHLVRNGTQVLKCFLHISRQEQKKRLLERLGDPHKGWKLTPEDFEDRMYWARYMEIYGEMLGATSTPEAPWYIIPADSKWFARPLISHLVIDAVRSLHLTIPEISIEKKKLLKEARRLLGEE